MLLVWPGILSRCCRFSSLESLAEATKTQNYILRVLSIRLVLIAPAPQHSAVTPVLSLKPVKTSQHSFHDTCHERTAETCPTLEENTGFVAYF